MIWRRFLLLIVGILWILRIVVTASSRESDALRLVIVLNVLKFFVKFLVAKLELLEYFFLWLFSALIVIRLFFIWSYLLILRAQAAPQRSETLFILILNLRVRPMPLKSLFQEHGWLGWIPVNVHFMKLVWNSLNLVEWLLLPLKTLMIARVAIFDEHIELVAVTRTIQFLRYNRALELPFMNLLFAIAAYKRVDPGNVRAW